MDTINTETHGSSTQEPIYYSLTNDYTEDGQLLFALMEAIKDTLYGAGETTFDTPFIDGYVLNHTIADLLGWTDLVVPNDASEIFLDADDNVVGTSLGHLDQNVAIYLSFMPEAAVDWAIVGGDTVGWDITSVDQFMGALIGYLGAVSPPLVDLSGSSTHFGVASGLTSLPLATAELSPPVNPGLVSMMIISIRLRKLLAREPQFS